MPNARRQTTPAAAAATVSRATIFDGFGNSIRDIVPVSNATDRAQLVTDLSAAGVGQAPSATKPLHVYRNDARGLHRTELTSDGSVWLPVSGVLEFATVAAMNTWTTANSALLTAGDLARVTGLEYEWTGTQWVGAWIALTLQNSWAAFGGAYQTPRYCRRNGIVFVQGRIAGGSVAPGTTIATLPAQYRPAAFIVNPVWQNGSARSIEIGPAGQIVVGDTAISSVNTDLTLTPWPADQ